MPKPWDFNLKEPKMGLEEVTQKDIRISAAA
jgi:hypothetical protein